MSSTRQAPLTVRAVGRPVATSGLARIILQIHQQRMALQLVPPPPTNDRPRHPVPAIEQGSV